MGKTKKKLKALTARVDALEAKLAPEAAAQPQEA